MYYIVIGTKSSGDFAVTHTYLSTIKRMIEKVGEQCELWDGNTKINKSNDYLIFDECKIAAKYVFMGYRNILIWIQGVVPEEALLKGYSKTRYLAYSFLEYIILKKAKIVFFCSDAMKQHYEQKYHLDVTHRSFIMPCFNETAVSETAFLSPRKFAENSFVYLGTLSAWQCFQETLKVYKRIELMMKGKARLYVYTPEKDTALRLIKEKSIKNYVVDFLPEDKLGAELDGFKYGFVLRRNDIVNRVATPTKLSNYIAHGIIPIYSDCLESFNKYVHESDGKAVVCNVENLETGIKNICLDLVSNKNYDELKSWCLQTFNTYYNRNFYCDKFARMWKSVYRAM